MQTSKIIAALPTLSKPDLAQIRAAADSLLGPQAAPNQAAPTPLLDAITRALGLRGGFVHTLPGATYSQYKRGEVAVTDFVAKAFPQACDSRVTYAAMMGLIVDCLLEDLRGRSVPLSIGTVCSNLERAPQVFRAAFPGYIEGGASAIILQKLGAKGEG
jgi:hypothetical protein